MTTFLHHPLSSPPLPGSFATYSISNDFRYLPFNYNPENNSCLAFYLNICTQNTDRVIHGLRNGYVYHTDYPRQPKHCLTPILCRDINSTNDAGAPHAFPPCLVNPLLPRIFEVGFDRRIQIQIMQQVLQRARFLAVNHHHVQGVPCSLHVAVIDICFNHLITVNMHEEETPYYSSYNCRQLIIDDEIMPVNFPRQTVALLNSPGFLSVEDQAASLPDDTLILDTVGIEDQATSDQLDDTLILTDDVWVEEFTASRTNHTDIITEEDVVEQVALVSFLENRPKTVPASEKSIQELEKLQVGIGGRLVDGKEIIDEQNCSICLDDLALKGGGVLSRMPCSHMFHEICIESWLKTSNFCPLCRFKMPSADGLSP